MNSQTQKITLQGEAGVIEALRDELEGVSRGVAIVAHPHPLFGGTMDNKVVQTLARSFVQCGWTVVRFNFRGVGASGGGMMLARAKRVTFCAWLSKWHRSDRWPLRASRLVLLWPAMLWPSCTRTVRLRRWCLLARPRSGSQWRL